jgi:hypothetical protein
MSKERLGDRRECENDFSRNKDEKHGFRFDHMIDNNCNSVLTLFWRGGGTV